jgi:hypothetical protein
VSAVAVSGDDRVVAVAHGREISVLDVGHPVPALLHHDRHDTSVTCLRWHPSSPGVLVAGSFERVARSEQLLTAVSMGRGADDHGLLVWEPRRSPGPLGFVATGRPVEHLAVSVGAVPFAVHP